MKIVNNWQAKVLPDPVHGDGCNLMPIKVNVFYGLVDFMKVKVTQSCPTLWDPMEYSLPESSVHGDSPGRSTGVGSSSLIQGIFLTQGSNPGLLHCRQILFCLSQQGSPRILEWVAYPFSSGSSQPRKWIRVSCIAGGCRCDNLSKFVTRLVQIHHLPLLPDEKCDVNNISWKSL